MAYTQQMRVQLPNGAPGRISSKVEPPSPINRSDRFEAGFRRSHQVIQPLPVRGEFTLQAMIAGILFEKFVDVPNGP